MTQFEQVIYVSRATVPMDSLQNISEILGISQRNNWRDGVTGALAFSDGRFLQVVEGRVGAIEGLLRRISADPRHNDVAVVQRRTVDARFFPDWSMAVPRISPENAPVMRRAIDQAATDPDGAMRTLKHLTEIDAIHS